MRFVLIVLIAVGWPAAAKTNGKCAEWVKLAAIEWAQEILNSDIETTKQIGAEPFTVEFMLPILQDRSKNPPKVAEVYSIDWRIKFKEQDWPHTGFYFFDEQCHRMRSAEYTAGKAAERKSR